MASCSKIKFSRLTHRQISFDSTKIHQSTWLVTFYFKKCFKLVCAAKVPILYYGRKTVNNTHWWWLFNLILSTGSLANQGSVNALPKQDRKSWRRSPDLLSKPGNGVLPEQDAQGRSLREMLQENPGSFKRLGNPHWREKSALLTFSLRYLVL
jgi:hypothetical protein